MTYKLNLYPKYLIVEGIMNFIEYILYNQSLFICGGDTVLIRERYEGQEKQMLSPYASLSINTKGRITYEEKCDIRTEYQRDRDRIIHSKAFRRLKHKTQVFIAPEGDHYRTRLTHTLEVAQIARTIARALRLNEDLTEAIALGHDLGHTPFGHTGEYVLNEICTSGFKHNEQSLRVVDQLESGKGLNLTSEVRDGILNHCGKNVASTLEGVIVKYADRIAYINHDIDDAIRAGVISNRIIPVTLLEILGDSHSQRINTMITDIITSSMDNDYVIMSSSIKSATELLRKFMFENVYIGSRAKTEENKARYILYEIFGYFKDNYSAMPAEYLNRVDSEGIERVVCDYIAGMTDIYAINLFNKLFIPSPWR